MSRLDSKDIRSSTDSEDDKERLLSLRLTWKRAKDEEVNKLKDDDAVSVTSDHSDYSGDRSVLQLYL